MSDESPPTLKVLIGIASSLVLAAAGIYLSSLLGLDPWMWVVDVVFWGGAAGAVGFVLVVQRRGQPASADGTSSWRDRARGAFVFLVPFAALLPGMIVFLRSPRLLMSFHGYLHSAYTYEILHGHFPPDNPLLAGEPANDYWLFHVLLASVVHVTRLAPPIAAALLNIAALCASVFLVSWIARSLRLWPVGRAAGAMTALFVLFGLNLFGVVHALVTNGFASSVEDPNLNYMALAGAARSAGLFGKYLNFNGFPLGVAFFLLAIGCAVRMTTRVTPLFVTGFLAGSLGAVAFHVTTGAFALAALPAGIVVSCLAIRRMPKWEMSPRMTLLVALAGVVVLATFGHYALTAAGALEATASIDLWAGSNAERVFGVTYPLLPLFVLGLIWAAREKRGDLLMLSGVALFGVLLSLVVLLPGKNQYKFDYLGGFALALVALAGWRILRERTSGRIAALAGVLGIVGVGLVLANQLYTAFGYQHLVITADKSIVYDGTNVLGGGSSPQSEAWEWIRDNTPNDAVVVVPFMSKDLARFLPISQRIAYVVKGGPYTAGNQEFLERRKVVRTLYSSTASIRDRTNALAALLRDAEGKRTIVAVPRTHYDAIQDLGAQRVYDQGGTRLYDVTDG